MESIESRIDILMTDTTVRFKKLTQLDTLTLSMHSDYKFYKEKRTQLDTEHSKRIHTTKKNLETIEKNQKIMEEKLKKI